MTIAQEDLRTRIFRFLHLKDVSGLENIQADVNGGTVVMSGRASTARTKSLCIEYCRHVAGVLRVLDELTIPDDELAECRTP